MSVSAAVGEGSADSCTLCGDSNALETRQGKRLCRPCVRKLRSSELLGAVSSDDDRAPPDADAVPDLGARDGVEHIEENRYLVVI